MILLAAGWVDQSLSTAKAISLRQLEEFFE